MGEVTVADLMTHEPITDKPETDLLSCVKKMVKKKVGCLLLSEKGNLKGFVSNDDILWVLSKKPKEDLSSIKAIDISPKKIITIRPDASVHEAISKMKKFKFERLPVVHDGKLVGIITAKDILTYNPEIYPELEEFSRIREESRKLKQIRKSKEDKSVYDGICEECGNTELLYKVDGMLLCASCREMKH